MSQSQKSSENQKTTPAQEQQGQQKPAVDHGNRQPRASRNQRRALQQEAPQIAPQQAREKGKPAAKPTDEPKEQSGDPAPRRFSLGEIFANGADDDYDVEDLSKPPRDITGAIKRLGVKPEEFDEVLIPFEGSEPIKFKDLRARVGDLVNLETEQTRFETRRIQEEGRLLRQQSEMREILAMIPPANLSPQLVDKVRKRHNAMLEYERGMTMEHIPAWQSEARMAEDRTGINKMLTEYGFDSTFLESVTDHRALKFLRDMYLRDKRIKEALSKVTVSDEKGQRPSQKTTKSPARPPTDSNRRNNGLDQNSKLRNLFND